MKPVFSVSSVFAGVLLMTACSEPPYIHDAAVFNRAHPAFGQTRTDRAEVKICYNTRGAVPADVAAIARDACGEFGKIAVFEGNDYAMCPLSHPVAATYSCVAKAAATTRSSLRF